MVDIHVTRVVDLWATLKDPLTGLDDGQSVLLADEGNSHIHRIGDSIYFSPVSKHWDMVGLTWTYHDVEFDDITSKGAFYATQYVYHDGDTDTYLRFRTNRVTIDAGGVDCVDVAFDTSGGTRIQPSLLVDGAAFSSVSAGIELNSTDKALLVSRMTTAQRDLMTPVDGMLFYNTTVSRHQVRVLGTWSSIGDVFSHQLDSPSYHTVSGLTPGHFLKATAADSFGFVAHGLSYTDVGAASTSDSRLSDARTPVAHQLDSATYHTVSGLTARYVLTATSATTFGFAAAAGKGTFNIYNVSDDLAYTSITTESDGSTTITNTHSSTGGVLISKRTYVNNQFIVGGTLYKSTSNQAEIQGLGTLSLYQDTAESSTGTRISSYKTISGGAVVTSQEIAGIDIYGHDGSNQILAAGIVFKTTGTIATSRVPVNIDIYTHPNSTSGSRKVASFLEDASLRLYSTSDATKYSTFLSDELGNLGVETISGNFRVYNNQANGIYSLKITNANDDWGMEWIELNELASNIGVGFYLKRYNSNYGTAALRTVADIWNKPNAAIRFGTNDRLHAQIGETGVFTLYHDDDDTKTTTFTVGGTGDLTIAPSGGDVGITGNLSATGDIYTTGWTYYGDTSTIRGFDSNPAKYIYYKRVGNTVFVTFLIANTSTETYASFTLPIAPSSDFISTAPRIPIHTKDNTSTYNIGLISYDNGNTRWNAYKTAAEDGFTASGVKQISGQFWYEV